MAEQSRTETELFSEQWATRLKQFLHPGTANDIAPPMHVPKALMSGNPEHYIPQFISLGPYHYHNFEQEAFRAGGIEYDEVTKMSIKEACKIKSAAALFSIIIKDGKNFDDMFAFIKSLRPQFERFYNWPQISEGKYSENSLMMMLDTLFFLYFLFGHDQAGDYRVRINCDILKLENQIPLFVVKEFFVKFELSRVLGLKDGIRELLRKAYFELSPFDVLVNIPGDVPDIERQPHLLGCIHAIVSGFLEIKCESSALTRLQRIYNFLGHWVCGIFFCFSHPKGEELPNKAYNAWELAKAGINFRSFSRPPHTIRFDKCSCTIYLPRMTVSSVQTEMLLKNLHAMEFIRAASDNTVTNFIQLMDCLIDTAEDVQVLRKCHVISSRTMLTDKDIAEIWESMRRPFFHDRVEPPKELKCALDEVLTAKYYKIKIRSGFCELFHYYYQQYFSKPWSFIAFLFGTFILAMNMVQAYCGLWVCNSKSPTKKL